MRLERSNIAGLVRIGRALAVAGLALWTANCSGGRERAPESIGATAQAVASDPLGTAFYYFRSNSTDWGVDEGSRLFPTQDPNVFSRTIDDTLAFDDTASLTATIAPAPDEWGTSQRYSSTPNQATFLVPNTVSLVSAAQELNFAVHYPHTGLYTVTFNATAGTLSIQPAGQDAGADGGGTDAATDAGGDAADAGGGGFWTQTTNVSPFPFGRTALLLTDGTVMVQGNQESSTWFRLTPDANGSYVNGTWSALASMPAGDAPEDFASAVLPDGRVIVEGGEHNSGVSFAETPLGAIYDPLANAWTPVSPPSDPSFLNEIGDAPSVVLPNGTFMMGPTNATTGRQALLNASTLTWTITGAGKADGNSEEGFTLLPNGKVLSVDANACCGATGTSGPLLGSELYDPATGTWSSAGSTVVQLAANIEVGPAVLMPTGIVFQAGATGHTGLYDSTRGTWTAGPDFPLDSSGQQLVNEDGPAALLPNGRVLVTAGPGTTNPTHFFEFDGSRLTEVATFPNAAGTPTTFLRMLVLPTGQILLTGLGGLNGSEVEIYTPNGSPNPAWAPTITSVATTLARGTTNVIRGTQFNGLSQGAAFGDDAQSASNYPLVRITNDATGHVAYARTHGHSTMAIATGTLAVSTSFDVSSTTETGASHLVVVANGIASAPVAVTID